MMWRSWMGSLLVMLLLSTAISAQDANEDQQDKKDVKPPSPAEQLQKLENDYRKAQLDFSKAYRAAKTPEDQQKVFKESYPRPDDTAVLMLKLAKDNPKDSVAIKALVWIMRSVRSGPTADEATRLISADFIESDQLGPVCQMMAYVGSPAAIKLLETAMEKNPHKDVKGQACYSLAKLTKRLAPDDAGKAEKLFERVISEFGDVKAFRGTLGEKAQRDLFELRFLAIGKEAPEIEGEDIDGESFKLSDYRGKVLVLDFWGDW